jgi:hypothetical protein
VAYLAVADPTQYTLPWLDDFCLSPTTLVEMYCSGNDLMYQKISCGADVCAAGACRTCTDTDPQDDPSVLGYATDVEGLNHSDYCVGDKLVQVNCNAQGEVDATLAIPCDSGTCKEGVCK